MADTDTPAEFSELRRLARVDFESVMEAEFRAEGDGQTIVGYASVFNSLSEDLGGFREIVRPGAFTKTLQESKDIRALWNHDTSFVLGRTLNGTLLLNEDERGLRVEIKPPDTQWARDLHTQIKRGDISHMSFGFSVLKDRWRADANDTGTLRELVELRLYEVSPVTFPAYLGTTVQARALGIDLSRFTPDQIRRALQSITDQPEPLGTTDQSTEPDGLPSTPRALDHVERDRVETLRRATSMKLESI